MSGVREVSDVEVSLRELTAETVRPICKLEVCFEQRSYVANYAVSIGEAQGLRRNR